ncbi:response regulator transcription factor [Cyclobacteriaceae bacterium]|jgi:two-component system alkaline phosphatase synthesis response regulator PhoP|nr:response regulator transcription factor [Cyclobacteriaceae bacterium]MDA9906613.1 response regulator transcription factor [Cyclobacteriaceae bacterium]MDC6484041.1 response regulator transcription factor [Cyclobacteriaceae bacterium]|tara:strand:+ start:162 stop:860 length:699 start_codon:yes stop_codon:yes gene_type:complete
MNSNTYKILVVDDDPDIVELLKYNLSSEGYKVKSASNGIQAVSLAREFIPDLTILDIMMPNMDGVETCRQIRSIPELANKFIIFLTARSEEYSEIAAFEMGADDYITKPIKPRALISRINALFRREVKKDSGSSKISIGNLEIDRVSYTVKLDNKKIILPKKEFELLFFLAQNPDQVFGRDDLLKNIWGSDVYVLARTVDVHIRKVREKIGDGFIITIKGVGYKFVGDQLSI